ncbi:MAG: 3-deoxy-D-manno-octulosonic acid transferase [Candidatus Binatia bacterium]
MGYWIYNSLLTLALIFASPVIPILFLMKGRFSEGLLQRLGFYPKEISTKIKGKRPIWIHAVSVGEVLSAHHLLREVSKRFPERKIVLSTFTATGNEIARKFMGPCGVVVFPPLDHPWIVSRALSLFDPAMLIILETEIWPNLLDFTHRRGIPTVLLSGRISAGAFRHYRLLRLLFSRVVRKFTALGMQSEEDATRMVRLGVDPEKIWITGSLKHVLHEEIDRDQTSDAGKASLKLDLKGIRQVWVVGSTHRGEEEVVLDAFASLKLRFPELFMVLAPRHPERFGEVERLLKKRKIIYQKKSEMNGRVGRVGDVILLDTLGDLDGFYSIADVAFIGGSLVDAGGHNLLEPARFRKPILFGPYMTNFAELTEELKQMGGGREVRGRDDLVREISWILTDQEQAERMGELAYGVAQRDRSVMQHSIALLYRYLHE